MLVLNAFRHQRKEHLPASFAGHTTAPVLNAFRHQRKEHKRHEARHGVAVIVLNAFRHQRKEHWTLFKRCIKGT